MVALWAVAIAATMDRPRPVVWAGNNGPAAQAFTPSQQQTAATALAHQPGTASYAAMAPTPTTPPGGPPATP